MKVVALVAQTLDGLIAQESNELVNWSCREDKLMFAAETKKGGVVVMGLHTFQTLPCPLPARLNIVLTSKADQFISQSDLLEFTSQAPQEVIKNLKKKGFKKIFIIGGNYTFTQFLKEKLLDEIWITLEPLIFGQGISLFGEKFAGITCQLIKIKKLNKNTLQVRYKINY